MAVTQILRCGVFRAGCSVLASVAFASCDTGRDIYPENNPPKSSSQFVKISEVSIFLFFYLF